MHLALFDIDETLIRKDCETLWCHYLTREGIYDMSRIEKFALDYQDGTLDFDAFARFQLEPLIRLSREELVHHRQTFLADEIFPTQCEIMSSRVAEHRERGDQLLVVSAAHDFLAEPVAEMIGISEGLFTVAEQEGCTYRGKVEGAPCFREGKVTKVTSWLAGKDLDWESLESSWFYSDSHNDLPLLKRVQHPVAVRPDQKLRQVALERDWEIIE